MKNEFDIVERIKDVTDYSALGLAGAAFLEWVSPVAALFSILWLSIRIWEKVTGRQFSTTYISRLIRCVECPLSRLWSKIRK